MPEATQKHNTSVLAPVLLVLKQYTLPLAISILIIFHAVGLWGLAFSSNPTYFQSLTPLNLLLTNALLFSFHRNWNSKFLYLSAFVFAVGFMVEVVGVHTGLLFGSYSYGSALGYKVWRVPLLIGLNWLMLVYTTGHMVNRLKMHWLLKAVAAAGLMVLLDFFIEPVAIRYDFWSWTYEDIPLYNFITWYVVAFLLQVCFQKAGIEKKNKLAFFVFTVQLSFFVALYSIIHWRG